MGIKLLASQKMHNWKKQYKKQLSLLKILGKKKGPFRFNVAYIKVSDIASQFYDEKKFDLEFRQPKLETEEMRRGTEGHENLVKSKQKITLEEGWKHIFTSKKLFLAEFPLIVKYKKVPIIGKPDLMIFVKGRPILLFEFKFSKYKKDYSSYHAQLRVEGLMLKELGFDTSTLLYVIIIAPSEMKKASKRLNIIPNLIFRKYIENKEKLMHYGVDEIIDNVVIYVSKFHTELAEDDLDWALDYWKRNRDAKD